MKDKRIFQYIVLMCLFITNITVSSQQVYAEEEENDNAAENSHLI